MSEDFSLEPIVTSVSLDFLSKDLRSGAYNSGDYFIANSLKYLIYLKINSELKVAESWLVDLYFGIPTTGSYGSLWNNQPERVALIADNKIILSSSEFIAHLREKYPKHLDWIIFNQFWLKKILSTFYR
jgi:hypothetical protein